MFIGDRLLMVFVDIAFNFNRELSVWVQGSVVSAWPVVFILDWVKEM